MPFYSFQKDTHERWAWKGSVFTPEECNAIIQAFRPKLSDATVINLHGNGQITNDVSKEYRDSKTTFLQPNPETEGIFQRISDAVKEVNNLYWQYELWGFGEGLQFTEYNPPGGKYDMHIDKVYQGPIRKLSITVQLSDPRDYEGGDFEYQDSSTKSVLPKAQGLLLAFPSYALHAVTPVTRGTRYSLVGWVTGPNLK